MSNKRFQKTLAVMLTGTMVLGMSTTAMAAAAATSGSTTGDGEFEGHVDTKVLMVELPTVPADDKTFGYTMDPEGLIAATEGAKDKDAKFEEGANVYFLSGEKTYTKDSAKLKVTNKGNVAADVKVEAETAANDKIAMAADGTFTEADTDAELYLGLKVAEQPEAAIKAHVDATDPVSVSVGLKGREGNFETTYDSDTGKYKHEAKPGLADTAWNSFEFGLTGTCNQYGDWSAADLAPSTVTVTWSYAERADGSANPMLDENATNDVAPSIPTTPYDYARDTALDITANFGTGTLAATAVTKVEASNDGTVATADWTTKCTITGTKITLPSGLLGGASVGDTRYLIVTFDNGKTAVATLNITK